MSPTGNPTPGSRHTALPTTRPLLDLTAMERARRQAAQAGANRPVDAPARWPTIEPAGRGPRTSA